MAILGSGIASDGSAATPSSLLKEDGFDESKDGPKEVKLRDLESVLQVQEVGNQPSNSSTINEAKVLRCQPKEGNSLISVAAESLFLDKLASKSTNDSSAEKVSSHLTLGPPEPSKECEQTRVNIGLGVDLNYDHPSHIAEYDPFNPFKKLVEIKSADASECGSTTGPMEESEPLRKWKQMKQNGFLSYSHSGIAVPKQSSQPRKRKSDRSQSKSEFSKKEQISRFANLAAPSGLLSGLNPGIINHVRNTKQVHSIIKAVVKSEKHDGQIRNRISDQVGRGTKEIIGRRKDHIHNNVSTSTHNPCISPSMEYLSKENETEMAKHNFHQGACATSQLTSGCEDDALTLKLSSTATLVSEIASSGAHDHFSENQQNLDSLSIEAAKIASQWLDLLQQDIKGRLAALRRSKKRVKNVILTELPYLISKEFAPNQENEPHSSQSSEFACSTKEMHVSRWKSLFSQMDRALSEEGKQLENWLKQVQEMQLHCENGLKFVGSSVSSHLISADNPSKFNTPEALELKYAVWAAAASIYSTCNLITKTDKS
ncbi:uncharacterized protein LOC122001897 [Zingiber officinale]|uniref:Uncharacterized protein n=1 Tax=Zingiber officinale TaxID=94328 RepID=A0A8J5FW81_ZINOF|nr:uncharacterized protein LOC122001897 [Zingiber officinale]KAG6493237.1 hypothetical protein ZIOFF_048214 [Zingiber officinale]